MKDPAVLFYTGDWLKATAEMDADCRGWYLNLILHNYDKKSLPNDIESLALLAGVKFSEYKRFEYVFEQVLKHKFKQTDEGRISNETTDHVLRSREIFQSKRSDAGKMSYLMKFFAKNYIKEHKDNKLHNFVKFHIDLSVDTKNEQMIKKMFEHLFELYKNENKNSSYIENYNSLKGENEILIPEGFDDLILQWLKYKAEKRQSYQSKTSLKTFIEKFLKDSKSDIEFAKQMIIHSISANYDGLFAPKQLNGKQQELPKKENKMFERLDVPQ